MSFTKNILNLYKEKTLVILYNMVAEIPDFNLNIEKIVNFHVKFLGFFFNILQVVVFVYLFTVLLPTHLSSQTIVVTLLVLILFQLRTNKIDL